MLGLLQTLEDKLATLYCMYMYLRMCQIETMAWQMARLESRVYGGVPGSLRYYCMTSSLHCGYLLRTAAAINVLVLSVGLSGDKAIDSPHVHVESMRLLCRGKSVQ